MPGTLGDLAPRFEHEVNPERWFCLALQQEVIARVRGDIEHEAAINGSISLDLQTPRLAHDLGRSFRIDAVGVSGIVDQPPISEWGALVAIGEIRHREANLK